MLHMRFDDPSRRSWMLEIAMREQMVAWAGDCVVRGDVSIGDGRVSDHVNQTDLLTFFGATLDSLEDGHQVQMDELEVERQELHIIEVHGHRGDPTRRLRTVSERVWMQVGPFEVTGNLHRPPNAAPMASLARWMRFVPMTEVEIHVAGSPESDLKKDVVLINSERISKTEPVNTVPFFSPEALPAEVAG